MRALPHISVCICTYKRPARLLSLLNQLKHQRGRGTVFTFSIVVVDNDEDESARNAVLAFSNEPSVGICYHVEARRNIALARNKALENAAGDYLAFLDDDEVASDSWLQTLLLACTQYSASGVLGPVLPRFEEPPKAWVVKGRFWERPRYPTGTILRWEQTRTGNALLRRMVLAHLEKPWFRPQFACGGEDDDFFRRLIAKGEIFVWCDQAVTYEIICPNRCRRRYLVRRAIQRGQNQRFSLSSWSLAKSLLACVYYAVVAPFAIFRHEGLMACAIRFSDHAGKLLAAMGVKIGRQSYVSSTD